MHPINNFCKQHGICLKQFAGQIKVSAPFVTQITKGKRRPSPDVALRIEQATDGAVTLRELLFPARL
jgi:DNA-binding transcriptional regulator YdaS (Cro superfamily)